MQISASGRSNHWMHQFKIGHSFHDISKRKIELSYARISLQCARCFLSSEQEQVCNSESFVLVARRESCTARFESVGTISESIV